MIPEEGSDKHFLVEQLVAAERLIDNILKDYSHPPHIYPTYNSLLYYFLQLVEYTTQILNDCYIS